ncbi:hypothetical protein [Streptomyces lavendulae]|uniref:hypothetical protein n=1 Tax=Streptomyces lavendulae TaxID=1914 RepID=UPI003820E70B
MSDVIVPVRVHALVVNKTMVPKDNPPGQGSETWFRWTPSYSSRRLTDKHSPEPRPYDRQGMSLQDCGVQVKWELPESLATGYYNAATGKTEFPLVPNRWLVVRYYGPAQDRKAVGWVVQSDFLEGDYPDFDLGEQDEDYVPSSYLSPRASESQIEQGRAQDWIGYAHNLSTRSAWQEPGPIPGGGEPFLTAAGTGLPAYAGFEPYQRNVFSFRDRLRDYSVPQPGPMILEDTLSYMVLGWYATQDTDILNKAIKIPGLLPPDAGQLPPEELLTAILTSLGWQQPAGATGITRTLYSGTALGIGWNFEGDAPESDLPDITEVKAAFGHSTDDAIGALTRRQTRSEHAATVLRSLYRGTADEFDLPDGPSDLATETHTSWFSGREGGYVFTIVPRPTSGPEPADPPPPVPDWLDDLNVLQARYDRQARELEEMQWRLWSVWWLLNLPAAHGTHPPGFDDDARAQLDLTDPTSLASRTQVLKLSTEALLEEIPHGLNPDQLDEDISDYAERKNLDPALQLKRTSLNTFYRPGEPVVVIRGAKAGLPLTRESEDPELPALLPCRVPSALLTGLKIGGRVEPVPTSPPSPDLGNLPGSSSLLLQEFALLDKAAVTLVDGVSALKIALGSRPTHVEGTLGEYADVWRQPWLPMYLMWELKYCPTPYHSEGTDHWRFGEEGTYHWRGSGAQKEEGGEAGYRWLNFKGRSFLAPSFGYVVRAQLARFLSTYPDASLEGLGTLRTLLRDTDFISQPMEGFNDWLLQHDGAAQFDPPSSIRPQVGTPLFLPDPGILPTQLDPDPAQRFQPVRAGQFASSKLTLVDRFGRSMELVDDIFGFDCARAASVTPDPPLEDVVGPQRLIQLPPRILQEARNRFEPIRALDDAPIGSRGTQEESNPVVGWLLVNYIDETLLVYAPTGDPLGELRLVKPAGSDSRVIHWTPLPHSPYPDYRPENPDAADDFTTSLPQLHGFLHALVRRTPEEFTDLMNTIDATLSTIIDGAAEADRVPARLAGRPVALIRARLDLQLHSEPLTNPSWQHAINPPPEDYPSFKWPIRLGDPVRRGDGLIGYFSSATGPDQPTHYDTFRAVMPTKIGDYIDRIGNGSDLSLPTKPDSEPETHALTLMADPHVPVHSTTDILPTVTLLLEPDLVQQALLRILISFRLNPLLAPTRTIDSGSDSTGTTAEELRLVMPQPSKTHGAWKWAERRPDPSSPRPEWTELPLTPADTLAHPGDPLPEAHAGYLQLRTTDQPNP